MTAIAEAFIKITADTAGIAGEIEQGAAKPIEKAGRSLSQRFGGAFKNPTVLNSLGAAAGTIIGTAVGRGAGAVLNGSAADSLGRFSSNLGSLGGGLAAIGVSAGALGTVAAAADGLSGATDLLSSSTGALSAAKGIFVATTDAETGAVTASGLARAKDLIVTLAHTAAEKAAAVASKVFAAGQWLVNAALTANPIGLVIVGVAALVAGFILAYRHSKTFRDIIGSLWEVLRKFIGFTPLGLLIGQFDHIKGAVSWLLDKLRDLGDKLKHLPGAGILSHIPGFASGGVLAPGLSIVGEHGPELIASARGGQRVYSNAQSKRMVGGGLTTDAAKILGAWTKLGRLDADQDRGHTPWMAINPNARLDTSQIRDRRNAPAGGGLTIHGGVNVVAHKVEHAADAVPRALRNLSHRLGF